MQHSIEIINRFNLLLAIACIIAAGCGSRGPNLVPVHGTITLNGKPLKKGNVVTQPAAGRGSNGTINPDGTFELSSGREPGALVAEHAVTIVAFENAKAAGAEGNAGRLVIPQRYTNPQTSGLSMVVTEEGPNTPKFELTSP